LLHFRSFAARLLSPAALLMIGAVLFVGCHREVVPVSGRVTLDGKPLPNAVVTFQPLSKKGAQQPAVTGSVGRTDADGRFALRVVSPEQPGAMIGPHTVTISTASAESHTKAVSSAPLPKAYRDGSLHFEVPPNGTSAADFNIKLPEPKREKEIKSKSGPTKSGPSQSGQSKKAS
jgi:hypothetical protein